MNKKISLGFTIAIAAVAVIVSSVVTLFVLFNQYDELLADLPDRARQYEKLADVDELVRSNYYGEIDSKKIDSSLASGYLSGLDDPYCYYIDSDDKDAYYAYIDGELTGIGLTSYYDSSTGYLRVSFVEDDSPAANNGITTDCYIISVNGKKVSSDNAEELYSLLNDSRKKNIRLEYIESADSDNINVLEIESGYRLKSCYYKADGTVAYIRLSAFYSDTHEQFAFAVQNIKAEGISAVILDLRNCNGNNLESATKIIDMIVPIGSEGSGAIYTAKNSSGNIIKQVVSDAAAENLSFAVLINDRTECAAELIACDLRDFGKAVIIGETSAGHGTMQEYFSLDNGGIVSITVAEIFPYISDSFDNVGVKPDFEVLTSESFKNQISNMTDFSADEQYQKAHSYLSGK